MTIVQEKVAVATVHYLRTSDTNYAAWGLHVFGTGLAAGEEPAWTNAKPFEGIDADGGVNHKINIVDDTKRVGVIVHGRPPGGNPDAKDTPNDRYFVPLSTPEIYLKEGDGRIFTCKERVDSCVVPSAS